jgi:plastocyanin
MRRLFLVVTSSLALVVAPSGSAATKTVKITRTAFTPSSVTIKTTDSVKWTNTDTINHQVVANGGAFASPILKPGQSYTFTFKTAGKYPYHDALHTALKGTVVVTGPPPAVTNTASQPIIVYGSTISLSGTVSNNQSGERVDIFARPYPQSSYVQLTTVLTATNGSWDFVAKPTILTTYQVRWKGTSSSEVSVAVRPRISLSGSRGLFFTRATAGRSFAGRTVYLQRLSSFGQWVAIRKLTLGSHSGRFFHLPLPRGISRLRVVMSQNQAGAGYLAGISSTLKYRRR